MSILSIQDDQACQVMLEMVKLAPIFKEVSEDIGMSGHEGSGGHDRKLHQALPFRIGGGIGPESIIQKSEMANHNSRVIFSPPHLGLSIGNMGWKRVIQQEVT